MRSTCCYPRAGELVRPYVLSRRERLPMATALSSVIVERTLDSLTLLLLVGIGLPLFADVLQQTLERLQLEPAAALPLLVGLLAVLLALMSLPRWAPGLLARLGQHAPRAAERLRRLARELYAGAAPLRSPRLLWRIGVQTALLWVCYLLPLYGLFWVFRLELTLWDAALVLLVSAVAIAVAPRRPRLRASTTLPSRWCSWRRLHCRQRRRWATRWWHMRQIRWCNSRSEPCAGCGSTPCRRNSSACAADAPYTMQQPTLEAVKRVDPLRERFHVSEIFYSIQGEGTRAGMPCVFVRLQGCKLRCSWCDTPYALDHRRGGTWMSGEELLEQVRRYGCRFVEFTGGEPLEQWGSFELMRLLCDEGYLVAVETGGHVDIEPLDPRIICILDVKCPASRMTPLNRYRNLELLRPHDEVKFVIADRTDYEWAWGIAKQYRLPERVAAVLFSPAFGLLEPKTLAEWILQDRLPVRLQLQLHKYIWDPSQRGV
jgi:7-carboxy-7-deazaguanine synthase